jgi:hypothetical protein
MGPLEKRLLSEFAISLIKNCSRAAEDVPVGLPLALADRRRWFARLYREWQLTPRVELAGRSPYEVINAERAAQTNEVTRTLPRPSIALYTDLPTLLPADTAESAPQDAAPQPRAADGGGAATHDSVEPGATTRWRQLADRLFGPWLDEQLDRL